MYTVYRSTTRTRMYTDRRVEAIASGKVPTKRSNAEQNSSKISVKRSIAQQNIVGSAAKFCRKISKSLEQNWSGTIPDEEILSRLSAFGTRRGSVRHGFVRTLAGIKIATGVRYVNFRLHHNRHVPSYVRTTEGAGKSPVAFPVMYDGQVRTCRHCNLPGHLAADCPRRSSRHAESASTVNDSQNQHESNLTQNNQRTTGNTTNTNSYTQQQQPRAQHQETPATAQSTTQKAFSALFTPQTTSPPLPLIATSRGKSAHVSPDLDNDGFQLAKGKHTFSQAAQNRTILNSSNSTLADADPQMLWARDSSAREMDLIRQRVRFRQSRKSSQ